MHRQSLSSWSDHPNGAVNGRTKPIITNIYKKLSTVFLLNFVSEWHFHTFPFVNYGRRWVDFKTVASTERLVISCWILYIAFVYKVFQFWWIIFYIMQTSAVAYNDRPEYKLQDRTVDLNVSLLIQSTLTFNVRRKRNILGRPSVTVAENYRFYFY
jgi:hypothetical protein